MQLEAPRITLYPPYVQATVGDTVIAQCTATGTPTIRYQWERIDSDLSIHAQVYETRLKFAAIRLSDQGEYRCKAVNRYGDDTRILQIFVSEKRVPEEPNRFAQVNVSPANFNGRPREEVRLECTTQRDGTIEWSKLGHSVLPSNVYVSRGVLVIRNSRPDDSGTYVCTASAPNTTPNTASSAVYIESPTSVNQPIRPVLQPLNDQYNVTQGKNFELECICTTKAILKWTKMGEEFESNVRQVGHTLIITQAVELNRGVYICVADSDAGLTNQVSTIIEIERKFQVFSKIF